MVLAGSGQILNEFLPPSGVGAAQKLPAQVASLQQAEPVGRVVDMLEAPRLDQQTHADDGQAQQQDVVRRLLRTEGKGRHARSEEDGPVGGGVEADVPDG